jgi:hypothetical protein
MSNKPKSKFHVYSIAWSPRGPAQVGITESLIRRLDDLQIACPFRLQIYGAFLVKSADVAVAVKTKILTELAPFRMIGEWLKLNPNLLLKHIQSTAKGAEPNAQPWKPTPLQRAQRVVNRAEFARRREGQRARAALKTAQDLDILIRPKQPLTSHPKPDKAPRARILPTETFADR